MRERINYTRPAIEIVNWLLYIHSFVDFYRSISPREDEFVGGGVMQNADQKERRRGEANEKNPAELLTNEDEIKETNSFLNPF